MANYLIRLRLPDRPGALGAVASRIGAVGGDVVSIDILQRDGGVVIDELGVGVGTGANGDDLVDLLRMEILEVDGVSVESLRVVSGPLPDRHAEVLEIATTLFEQTTPTGVIEYLVAQVRHSLSATFAAALDPDAPWPVASDGDGDGGLPTDDDLRALARSVVDSGGPAVDGSGAAGDGSVASDDRVVAARLARAGVVLLVGRSDPVFRAREHRRVLAMAELADHRWSELTSRPLIE